MTSFGDDLLRSMQEALSSIKGDGPPLKVTQVQIKSADDQPHFKDSSKESWYSACFCVGPQNGEKLCPCALREKAREEAKQLQDGIVIKGRRYKLIAVDEKDGK